LELTYINHFQNIFIIQPKNTLGTLERYIHGKTKAETQQ